MKSWKLACRTASCSPTAWSFNALRFATKEECEVYGRGLYSRWTALTAYEAQESDEPVNTKLTKGEDGRWVQSSVEVAQEVS